MEQNNQQQTLQQRISETLNMANLEPDLYARMQSQMSWANLIKGGDRKDSVVYYSDQ